MIGKSQSMAVVGKLEAAERLIVSGILMTERGDDPFAIHVVAASALNMLRELIQQGGDDYVAGVLRQGLFHAASALQKGSPVTLPTSPEIDALIKDVAKAIETGAVKQPNDLTVMLNADEWRKLLAYITRPFNFLKHAHRDPLATLDEDDVDPTGTIVHALTAYSMLAPGKALPEQIAPFLRARDLARASGSTPLISSAAILRISILIPLWCSDSESLRLRRLGMAGSLFWLEIWGDYTRSQAALPFSGNSTRTSL